MASGREKKTAAGKSGNGANLGFDENLWAAPDKLRRRMDTSEYKNVVLGLIFRIGANAEEIATLPAIRDALLPKLLSGEIRVKDAEAIAEGRAR